MQFQEFTARPHWKILSQQLGYLSAVFDNPPYWSEALEQPFCAVFDEEEITSLIEPATKEIIRISEKTVEEICNGSNSEHYFDRLKIPVVSRKAIRASWNRRDKSLWGRLDFSYSNGHLKLLELNFDGAISLYEAAVFQSIWLHEMQEQKALSNEFMQSNSIHEQLVAAFTKLTEPGDLLHFVSASADTEEAETVKYVQSCAVLAGHSTKFMLVKDLGFDSQNYLRDLDMNEMKRVIKLYPWEFLLQEDAKLAEKSGKSVLMPLIEKNATTFYEPIWKLLLANKGIMIIMKELEPDCPYLLQSALEGSPEANEMVKQPHVKKPLFGMQGSNVSIVYPDDPMRSVSHPGTFDKSGFLIQELHPLPTYNDYHVLVGSWVIDNKPAGIGIRADLSPITTGTYCLFIPHYVRPADNRSISAIAN